MTKAKHLTEEALLELAGKRLSGEDRYVAEGHLAVCKACRDRYERLSFAHNVFARMAEVGLQEVLAEPVRKPAASPRREFPFPWRLAVSTTLTCICIVTFLLYPRAITAVRASELLSNAIRYENPTGEATLFRVRVGEQVCAGGKQGELLISSEKSPKCLHALQYMKATPWSHGNPLSARAYSSWRNSLHRHRDYVLKLETSWQIKTTTEEGPVRAASLEMRISDYHSMELKLDFEDSEELSITEYKIPFAERPSTTFFAIEQKQKGTYIDSPGDLLEVQAWKTLNRIGADTGWDGIVVRNGFLVSLDMIGAFDDKKELMSKAFRNLPDVKLEMRDIAAGEDPGGHLPPREFVPITGQPLADTLLNEAFPNDSDRNSYLNNEEMLSRAVLGRAFLLDKLKTRQLALAHCSCAKDLADLVRLEERQLVREEITLSKTLEPLIGHLPSFPSRPLKMKEAENLDATIQGLLKLPEGQDESTLKAQIADVRHKLLSSSISLARRQ